MTPLLQDPDDTGHQRQSFRSPLNVRGSLEQLESLRDVVTERIVHVATPGKQRVVFRGDDVVVESYGENGTMERTVRPATLSDRITACGILVIWAILTLGILAALGAGLYLVFLAFQYHVLAGFAALLICCCGCTCVPTPSPPYDEESERILKRGDSPTNIGAYDPRFLPLVADKYGSMNDNDDIEYDEEDDSLPAR